MECKNPDLNTREHLWGKWLHPRRPHPPSVPDLTNAITAEWWEILTAFPEEQI